MPTTPEQPSQSKKPFSLNLVQFCLGFSILLAALYNQPLWRIVSAEFSADDFTSLLSFSAFAVFLVLIFSVCLTLIFFRYSAKPLALLLIISSASASYFMSNYGIVFDKSMIQNLLETDPAEVQELLNVGMLSYFSLYAILPGLLVLWLPLNYHPLLKELKFKCISALAFASLAVLITAAFYQDFSSLFRNNREMRNTVIPSSFIYYTSRYLSGAYAVMNVVAQPIGEDAVQTATNTVKPKLTILVIGETARAQNFSLNGYERETNPKLKQQQIFNFSDTSACGTTTAISLPCMFSLYNKDGFTSEKSEAQHNLLDVLDTAGVNVLWRDNNSGCKGVCERIETQPAKAYRNEQYCNQRECFDQVMLNDLDSYLDKQQGDVTVVLHQKGNHGPAYFLRYPESFKQFTPVCTTSQLQQCQQQSIVNAYDNAILYTDHFLSAVIDYLKDRQDRYRGAMLYMSDHGESLGENNLYLHGLPYFIAPKTQTQVPFILWLSQSFSDSDKLDRQCITDKQQQQMSHDNLFHSMLGLLSVRSSVYNQQLDMLASCRDQ